MDNQKIIKNNIRLDKFLHNKLPTYSRSFLKSQIKSGNVLVNNKIKKPSYILKPNDKIEVKIATPKKIKSPLSSSPYQGGDKGVVKLKIIYEDKDIIAIDKPAGISVHPTASKKQNDTIANALLAHYPAIKNVGDQPDLRPGIVHRLDKDTSGIMIAAKNQKAFDWLKKQFAERKVVKKYSALVCGKLKEKKGVIAKPIGKTKDFRKRTTISIKGQKEAVTYYEIIRHYLRLLPSDEGRAGRGDERKIRQHLPPTPSSIQTGNYVACNSFGIKEEGGKKIYYTLVEAKPRTGRTHQIRVHFASISHPIAGDKLYAFKRQTPPEGLKRQFLHASYLKFSLPNGKIIELKSELPEDLHQVLDLLNK